MGNPNNDSNLISDGYVFMDANGNFIATQFSYAGCFEMDILEIWKTRLDKADLFLSIDEAKEYYNYIKEEIEFYKQRKINKIDESIFPFSLAKVHKIMSYSKTDVEL